MLMAQPLKAPLRHVLLLLQSVFSVLKELVDDWDERVELRPNRRLRAALTLRHDSVPRDGITLFSGRAAAAPGQRVLQCLAEMVGPVLRKHKYPGRHGLSPVIRPLPGGARRAFPVKAPLFQKGNQETKV